MSAPQVTLSIVSHRQNALVNQLLEDIQRVCADRVALVLTENVEDPIPLATAALSCPVERIANQKIKGYGANHNAAFKHCRTPYFCVANPDIRLLADPFPALLHALEVPGIAVAGPLVRDPAGRIEDSARRFPTVASLLSKIFAETRTPEYPTDRGAVRVDWIAGMFMLFRREAFEAVNGFDEAYFLYYEDVDICDRLRTLGHFTTYETQTEIVHNARRGSRRDLTLALHHIRSAARFLTRRSASR